MGSSPLGQERPQCQSEGVYALCLRGFSLFRCCSRASKRPSTFSQLVSLPRAFLYMILRLVYSHVPMPIGRSTRPSARPLVDTPTPPIPRFLCHAGIREARYPVHHPGRGEY